MAVFLCFATAANAIPVQALAAALTPATVATAVVPQPTPKTGWSPKLAAQYQDSLKQGVPHFREITQWKQGQHGNCATIAFTKAANAVFGSRLYQQVEPDGHSGYKIVTQGDRHFELSHQELNQAYRAADFRGPDSAAKAQAIVTVGTLAKCYSADAHVSYKQALDLRMNQGAGVGEFSRCLGIPYLGFAQPKVALQHLAVAGPTEAGVISALYGGETGLEGHAEAIIAGQDGRIVGDAYGRVFEENLEKPTVLVNGRRVDAWDVVLVAESWNKLSQDAFRKSVSDHSIEILNSKATSPAQRSKAELLLYSVNEPKVIDQDLQILDRSLVQAPDSSHSPLEWLAQVSPQMSESGARQAYEVAMRTLAYSQSAPAGEKTAAAIVLGSRDSLTLQDLKVLSQDFVQAPQAAQTTSGLAQSVVKVLPRLSPKGAEKIADYSLYTIKTLPASSPAHKALANGSPRDYQIRPQDQAAYKQQLLQAIAAGSQTPVEKIADAWISASPVPGASQARQPWWKVWP